MAEAFLATPQVQILSKSEPISGRTRVLLRQDKSWRGGSDEVHQASWVQRANVGRTAGASPAERNG